MITGLRLRNWRCFYGEQEIALGSTTYGVVAEQRNNRQRSNWLGKSSFLDSIRYCITGQADDKTRAQWITRGEAGGGVDIELADGVYVSRGKEGTAPEQLLVIRADGSELRQDVAQEWLSSRYCPPGLWDMSFHVGQDETSRLVKMTPGERASVITEWAGLAIIDKSIDASEERLSKAQARLDELLRDATQATDLDSRRLKAEEARVAALGKLTEAREALAVEQERDVVLRRYQHDQQRLARRSEVAKQLEEAREVAAAEKAHKAAADELADECARKRADVEKQATEVKRLAVLVESKFDGACPVSKGFGCPATTTINGLRTKHREQHAEAVAQFGSDPWKEYRDLDSRRTAAANLHAASIRAAGRVAALTEELAGIDELTTLWKSPPPAANLQSAQDASEQAAQVLGVKIAELKAIDAMIAKRAALADEIATLKETLAIRRASCLVFKRAHRDIINGVLTTVRGASNGALEQSGVDLSVKVSWGREGKRLSRTCEGCGYWFGESQAAKACPSCSTTRPPQYIPSLEIEPSSVSGGARDITGLMVQMAAAAWLRDARGYGWSTYLIDEPFGGVDRANRLALAARLDSLLRSSFGIDQAFVVAHDRDTLEALPSRISIVSSGGRSTVEVV
jgi:rubrerythrin